MARTRCGYCYRSCATVFRRRALKIVAVFRPSTSRSRVVVRIVLMLSKALHTTMTDFRNSRSCNMCTLYLKMYMPRCGLTIRCIWAALTAAICLGTAVNSVYLTTFVFPLRRGLHIPYWMATIYRIYWGTAITGPPDIRCRGLCFYERPSSVVPGFPSDPLRLKCHAFFIDPRLIVRGIELEIKWLE